MKLPELPPGCALDPGWTDDHHGHVGARKGNGIGNVLAKTTDKDELEALAASQALREARIELWRDLYQRMTTAEQRIKDAIALHERFTFPGWPDTCSICIAETGDGDRWADEYEHWPCPTVRILQGEQP